MKNSGKFVEAYYLYRVSTNWENSRNLESNGKTNEFFFLILKIKENSLFVFFMSSDTNIFQTLNKAKCSVDGQIVSYS